MTLGITFRQPALAPADAEDIVVRRYGRPGAVRPLPSERDQNFLVRFADGKRAVLKIAHAGEDRDVLELQHAALRRLSERAPGIALPRVLPAADGSEIVEVTGAEGETHQVRLLSWVPGTVLALIRPHTPELLESLGRLIAQLDTGLEGLDHPAAHRGLKWDLARAEWIGDHLDAVDDAARRALATRALDRYRADVMPALGSLPAGMIYNDANDHNVLVRGEDPWTRRATGAIDFGDLVHSAIVCDVAIAAAYAALGKADPLAAAARVVAGYQALHPLGEAEIDLLDALIETRLAVSVVNSAVQRAAVPENPYLTVSEAPAWETLERLARLPPRFARCVLRDACGLSAVATTPAVVQWLTDHPDELAPVIEADFAREAAVLDLSVGSPAIANPHSIASLPAFMGTVAAALAEAGKTIGIGRYDEPRLLYTTDAFRAVGNDGPEWRTVHIGLDLFLPPGTPVQAPLGGTVHSFRDNAAPADYGPTIILRHTVDGGRLSFFTLYGHLDRDSLAWLRPGVSVAPGTVIGRLGEAEVNGGWPPHLHFQIVTDLLDLEGDFPGVARPSQRRIWKSLSPDPNLLARVPSALFPAPPSPPERLLDERRHHLGPSLSLAYRRPVEVVRGWMEFLYDREGRRYLDAVNNVPHVGHGHPRVVRAGQRQMALLNTNTRYLHELAVRYAERLWATLPSSLSVCYFVNSGSEANELALRLARAYTGRRDVIVLESGYHGNTTTLVDVSPYKHDGPGGAGAPSWVHKVPLPDTYRGRYRRDEPLAGERYAAFLAEAIARIRARGAQPAAFLCESIPSCGGQVVLPDGYLTAAYAHVRRAGGVCIADEVQTGFGRSGSHFWAFETQDVVPDIVTLGKPMGNGHPLGAVVTTPEIAAAFANGMEFFSTFGGNPVSCAIGIAVLDVIADEGLQENARLIGERVQAGLRSLASRHPPIGDVRGLGLFLGVELVRDRTTLEPAGDEAGYVASRMRERGVLVGTDGPFHNVLKIKPPLVFTKEDADHLVTTLDEVLAEGLSHRRADEEG
ncbi:MAG TPA: aminotransferase class III-fold pyridoxal phosphate-dependent enzyme [Gemmatimonadales bacterium]|nr:aminotransferase class III-fold pyridoxal phosphate-dependent enzyme [Gemmatimonadales bacterium]